MTLLTLMYSFSLVISVILLGLIIKNKISDHVGTDLKSLPTVVPPAVHLPEESPVKSASEEKRGVPIGALRHYGDIDVNPSNASFFISEAASDALGIYLSMTSTIIDVLTKIAANMDELSVSMDDPSISAREISLKLATMDQMLQPLVVVGEKLNSQIYQICNEVSNENEQTQLKDELVMGFITSSRNMIHYAIEYLHLTNIVRIKVEKRDLPYTNEFNKLNTDFIRIFFIGILNCTSMLDETIRVFR